MTKVALVTTTIHVPEVLRLYRVLDPDVRFFIAGDLKTPSKGVALSCNDIGNAAFIDYTDQKFIGWACSEPIGWNCIQRRNIATLEALKWGADIIVSIDDDNLPIDSDYFLNFQHTLSGDIPWSGIQASSMSGWFDVGQLLDPVAPHRGFPYTRYKDSEPTFSHVVGAKVGVAAGICLGDPDIDAVTRIARGPIVHRASELLRAGIVVDPARTTTVFNSQNTAFVRALAPAMFMMPGVSRYDDIFASLITQRVMRDHGYVTHFGQPFVWQQRNQHNLINDLKAEILGMEHVVAFAEWLDGLDLTGDPLVDTLRPLDQVRGIYTLMSALDWMPAQARAAGLAWVEDCVRVMG